jgi:hypothetical protein
MAAEGGDALATAVGAMSGDLVVLAYLAVGAVIGEAMAPQPRLSVRIGWCLIWPVALLVAAIDRAFDALGARR